MRTQIKRNGEKSLLIKLDVPSDKLAALVKKAPRIRIVEGDANRPRREREVQEEAIDKESPPKPFGGILSKEDADTSKTTPNEADRGRFDRAKEALVFPLTV